MHIATGDASRETLLLQLADLDARMAEILGAGLKTKRNGLIQLIQLPNELLIRIVAHLVRAAVPKLPHDFLALTAVCTRLRTLYLSTPELWTRISTCWDEAVLEDFVIRAAAYPLDLVVRTVDAHDECQVLHCKCLHRAKTLHITLMDDEDNEDDEYEDMDRGLSVQIQYVMGLLKNADAPSLRQLVLHDDSSSTWSVDPEWMLEPDVLSDAACVGLTLLKLLGVHIIEIPGLPALQLLDMDECWVAAEALHAALLHTPELEHLYLRNSLLHKLADKPTPPLNRLALPLLRYLYVQRILLSVASILGVLPHPSEAFLVSIERERSIPPWSSTTGAHASVLERLTNFWKSRTGSPNLPHGQLIRTLDSHLTQYHSYIGFGVWPSSKESDCYPVVFYYAPCNTVGSDDPLIDTVHAVHFEFQYPFQHGAIGAGTGDCINPGAGHPNLLSLRRVEEILIQRMRLEDAPASMTEALEAWLISRFEPGSPLRLIEFRGCAETARPLFERIGARSWAHTVTWVDGPASYAYRGDFHVL